MKRIIAFITAIAALTVLCTPVFSQEKNAVSFELAKERLLKNSPVMLELGKAVEDADERYSTAMESSKNVDMGPIITTIDIPGGGQVIYYYHYNEYMKMQLTQKRDLYPDQTKHYLRLAQWNAAAAENRLVLALRDVYMGVLSADLSYALSQKKQQNALDAYGRDKARYESGLITALQLEESEYNSLKAEKEAEAARRSREAAVRNFNSFVGEEVGTGYDEIVYNEEMQAGPPAEVQHYIDKAMRERLAIISVESEQKLKEEEKEIMEVNTVHERYPDARERYADLLLEMETNGRQLQVERLNIEKELKEAYVDVVNARSSLKNLQDTLGVRKKDLQYYQSRYELGLVTRDVLEQLEAGIMEMENAYKLALYDYNTRVMRLNSAAGIGPGYAEE